MSAPVADSAQNITITSSCPPDTAAAIRAIPQRMATEELSWITELRVMGVRAAHPDDGWVDRERNTVHLCYPQFGGRLQAGDLLALGSPCQPTRIVRVTGFSANRFASAITVDWDRWYVHFETAERILRDSDDESHPRP